MEIEKKLIQLTPEKNTFLRYIHSSNSGNEVGVLILPALGVKARYYEPLLKEFSAAGYSAAVVDLHGQGESSVKASRKVDFGYKEILEEDIPSAINTTLDIFGRPLIILGHSLGGQMASLYLGQYSNNLKGLILCTSCSVYYKGWKGFARLRSLAGTQFCMVVSKALGYFPGNIIGFGGITGKRLIHDWAYQARTGKYKVAGSEVPWEQGMKNVQLPVLAVSLENDFLAPKEAVAHLCQKLNNASVSHTCLNKPSLNHFSWVKEPGEFLKVILPWINKTIGNG